MRHASSIKLAFPYQTFSFYWFDEGRATHCLSLNNVIIQQKLDVIHCRQDVGVLQTHHILASQMAVTLFHHSFSFLFPSSLGCEDIKWNLLCIPLFQRSRDRLFCARKLVPSDSFALWFLFLLGKLKFYFCPALHMILGKSSGLQIC